MSRSKGLIIMSGECFREGNMWSRLRDTQRGYDGQKIATDSHGLFFNKILETNDIDIYLNTYNTKYYKELEAWYQPHSVHINYLEHINPYGAYGPSYISTECLNKLNIDNYEWILCFRPDLILKSYFIDHIFNTEWDQLMYPYRLWLNWLFIDNGFINMSDTMLFCPKKLFHIIKKGGLQLFHDGLYNYINKHQLDKNDFNFMIKTLHDSDSFKDYNPLYTMAGREENKYWYSYGYEVDPRDKYEIHLTNKHYVFNDWNLLDNNIPINEKLNITNLEDAWEWWHQDNQTINKFHNIIELHPIDIFHGQRVRLSRHMDQTYWEKSEDKIFIYHADFRRSSIFNRVSDYIYEGNYEFDPSVKFMLRKLIRPNIL
jgi:hypothetical protein